MKTRNCDECAHFSVIERGEPVRLKICAKNHKPRFYHPNVSQQGRVGSWGWKRRCDDFDAVVTIEIEVTK